VERNERLIRRINDDCDEIRKLRNEIDELYKWISKEKKNLEDKER
jgi:hypothetical protein